MSQDRLCAELKSLPPGLCTVFLSMAIRCRPNSIEMKFQLVRIADLSKEILPFIKSLTKKSFFTALNCKCVNPIDVVKLWGSQPPTSIFYELSRVNPKKEQYYLDTLERYGFPSNWPEFFKWRVSAYHTQFEQMYNEDDVDQLKELASKPGCEIGPQFFQFDLMPDGFSGTKKIEIASYAAFVGACQCFRFLWLNFPEYVTEDTFQWAVAGGNLEIIQVILETFQSVPDGCIFTAINFHRRETFEWLIEFYPRPTNFEIITCELVTKGHYQLFDFFCRYIIDLRKSSGLTKDLVMMYDFFSNAKYSGLERFREHFLILFHGCRKLPQ